MECFKVVVEIPKGSRNKYERNAETGEFELDRRLWASVAYPTEYGFIADTKAGDGDELDALIAVTEPTFTGCVIWARPVALLRMRSDDEDDPKVFCVPDGDPAWESLKDKDDIPDELCTEIAHFFDVYGELRGENPSIEGWGPRSEALDAIEKARAACRGE